MNRSALASACTDAASRYLHIPSCCPTPRLPPHCLTPVLLASARLHRQRKAVPIPVFEALSPQPVLGPPSLEVIRQPPQIPLLGDDPMASVSLARRINQVVRSFQV